MKNPDESGSFGFNNKADPVITDSDAVIRAFSFQPLQVCDTVYAAGFFNFKNGSSNPG
jgi:hypothetical protein